MSLPNPANFPFFIPNFRKDCGFHAIVKERVLLDHINNAKPDNPSFGNIPDPKEKPLIEPPCINIVLQNKLKMVFGDLVGVVQVARLEVGLELD